MGVCDAELIEVVCVRQSEDYGGVKNNVCRLDMGKKEERDGRGAEENLFCDWALRELVGILGKMNCI